MKRKPDVMIAVVALFFVGLVVSGFSSALTSTNKTGVDEEFSQSRQVSIERTASRY